jgi:RimJ/RimL family protein N-acetyltransferase
MFDDGGRADLSPLDDGILRLRPLAPGDEAATRRWRSDPGVWARTMGFRLPITEAMEHQWYDALAADNGLTRVVFGVELVAAGELIGFVQLNEIDWISRTASFGIVIGDPDQRGRGHGRRTLELATAYATAQLGLRKLTLRVVADNDDAMALYRAHGWIEEGRQVDQFFVDGTLHDVVLMGRFLP